MRSRVPPAANVWVLRTHLAPRSQRLCSRYVLVERWANRLHAARIGSYSGWLPLRCVCTASPMSRTIVVRPGGSILEVVRHLWEGVIYEV